MKLSESAISNLQENLSFDKETGCCLWSGEVNAAGTPVIYENGVYMFTLRVLYELKHGEPPPHGSKLLQLPRCATWPNKGCMNPDHYYVEDEIQRVLTKKIEQRCDRPPPASKDRNTACWVWIVKGAPQMYPKFQYQGQMYDVASLLFDKYQGASVRKRRRVWLRRQCGNTACVNPEHIVLGGYNVPITRRLRDL